MDRVDARVSKNDLCYALVLVGVLAVIALSLFLQLLALRDDDQVALAQAVQAVTGLQQDDAGKVSVQERKS